jgi:hypothetical protein
MVYVVVVVQALSGNSISNCQCFVLHVELGNLGVDRLENNSNEQVS